MLFVIKPTAACNGACIYCSAYKHHPDELGRMSLEQTESILSKIEEFISVPVQNRGQNQGQNRGQNQGQNRGQNQGQNRGQNRVSILWHGGEPLIMGQDYYEGVARISKSIEERTGVGIRHMMQSNITLVTDEFARFLKGFLSQARLGSSYDPIEGIRLLKEGRSYEEEWKKGQTILKEAGVGVGVVYVVHRESLGRAHDIYHGLKDLGLDGGMRFNPLYSAGLARDNRDLHITAREWGMFLLDLWKVWNEDERTLQVDPLRSWNDLAHGKSVRTVCAFSGKCTLNFTGIKSDGTVYSCGRSMDEGLMPFGNIFEQSLSDILRSPARKAYLNRKEWLLHGECAGCRWWSFCHGGCPNDAHLEHGDMLRKTFWCEGRKLFLDETFGKDGKVLLPPEPGDTEALFDESVKPGRGKSRNPKTGA